MRDLVLRLGSLADSTDEQTYHLSNGKPSFEIAYADILVITVLVYTLTLITFGIFDGLVLILKVLLTDLYTHWLLFQKVVNFAVLASSAVLAYISVTHHFYLASAAVAGLVILKHSLWEPQGTQACFPLLLYHALFADKYMVELWRIQEHQVSYHYQENLPQMQIPALLYSALLLVLPECQKGY